MLCKSHKKLGRIPGGYPNSTQGRGEFSNQDRLPSGLTKPPYWRSPLAEVGWRGGGVGNILLSGFHASPSISRLTTFLPPPTISHLHVMPNILCELAHNSWGKHELSLPTVPAHSGFSSFFIVRKDNHFQPRLQWRFLCTLTFRSLHNSVHHRVYMHLLPIRHFLPEHM